MCARCNLLSGGEKKSARARTDVDATIKMINLTSPRLLFYARFVFVADARGYLSFSFVSDDVMLKLQMLIKRYN